jgi:hypothetical protein
MSTDSNPIIFLKFLERYEKQSREITSNNALIELFCNDIIPLLAESKVIASLREGWRNQRDQLNKRLQETEEKASKETIATFKKVKASIGDIKNQLIEEKISTIDNLVINKNKIYSDPFYRILYRELKQLFYLLLQAGHSDICKKYAKLATHKEYVQKNPDQKERWAIIQEDDKTPKILTDKELTKAKSEGLSLISVPVDYELIEKPYIDEFLFAPSVVEAYEVMDAIHWDQVRNPAIVWWYFESALWCWHTPEIHFDQILTSNKKKNDHKYFQVIGEKFAWQEIVGIKNTFDAKFTPIIFTNNLFQMGFKTLINAIYDFLLKGDSALAKNTYTPEQNMVFFELKLNGNELWVHVTLSNDSIFKFYLQKFNEGIDADGSLIYRFMKDIIKNPEAGEKKANLSFSSESASKHINRIRLPVALKQAFFGRASRATFHFNGAKIALRSNDKETKAIFNKLRENHLKYYK